MSKKKNTLKELDEFLKQQAATLVSPSKLSDKIEPLVPAAKEETSQTMAAAPAPEQQEIAKETPSAAQILAELKQVAQQEGTAFRGKLYDLIIQSIEFQNQYSPEDKILINTALYLKHGERWKEAIREYWKTKK